MGKIIFHDLSLSREDISKVREQRFLDATAEDKLNQLFRLIKLSVKMNGGNPLKTPQGKGIIITK